MAGRERATVIMFAIATMSGIIGRAGHPGTTVKTIERTSEV